MGHELFLVSYNATARVVLNVCSGDLSKKEVEDRQVPAFLSQSELLNRFLVARKESAGICHGTALYLRHLIFLKFADHFFVQFQTWAQLNFVFHVAVF
jgi:hypothetical protein